MTRTYRIEARDRDARLARVALRERDVDRFARYSADDVDRFARLEALRVAMRGATVRVYASDYYAEGDEDGRTY